MSFRNRYREKIPSSSFDAARLAAGDVDVVVEPEKQIAHEPILTNRVPFAQTTAHTADASPSPESESPPISVAQLPEAAIEGRGTLDVYFARLSSHQGMHSWARA